MDRRILNKAYLLGLKRARDIAHLAAFQPGGRDTAWQMIEREIDKWEKREKK